MRSLLLLAPALLAACSTVPAQPAQPAQVTPAAQPAQTDTPPVRGETPGHTCNAAGTDQYLGQPGTEETGAAIKAATKAAVLRWAPPGVMLTTDFRADRVTVRIDVEHKVTQISCG